MELSELIKCVNVTKIIGDKKIEIKDVSTDSNSVQANSLFICINGQTFDGHDYIKQAENYGAVAIVTEREIQTSLTQVIVDDARHAMSIIASNFYRNPCEKLKIIGVTGTNGKTTTTHLIKRILEDSGISCGVIGTLGVFYNKKFIEPSLTTPDPLLLHKVLKEMVDDGVEVVAMEVSAHALYYGKLDGIKFEVGVLTNVTQDHLDFFKTMNEYKDAKMKLFKEGVCKYRLVNADDKAGLELTSRGHEIISYGIDNPSDVFAIDIKSGALGSKFVINLFDIIFEADIGLIGRFNVYNAMAAAAASALVGASIDRIEIGLNNVETVSGRLELVYNGDFFVFVDYAHTPDGLQKTISALKDFCDGKLICVFGCGGNRDKEKRAIMGAISGKYADFTVVTSDNPRYEEPMDIIYEVERGVLSKTRNYVIVQDRAEGIKYALNMAKRGDVVLVAGKGSEKYQEILGIKHVFNDKDTINEILGDKNC